MPDVDVTIIGGGVVGCAIAAAAAGRDLSTVLLEKEPHLGAGTTSRNSEVAHGGMYYPTDSIKAEFCVRGRRQLKEFCAVAGLPYHELGKLIIAVTAAEEDELQRLLDLGRANGVEDLELLDSATLAKLEPNVRATAALHSPRTAIFSAEQTAQAYGKLARERGAQTFTGAECVDLKRQASGWRVAVAPPAGGKGVEPWVHSSRLVVNAAGLYADRIASLAGVDINARGWRLHWVKGNYFGIAAEHADKVARLIYPIPPTDGATLGVHVCIDLGGRLRLGPDFQPLGYSAGVDSAGEPIAADRIASEDYAVDRVRAALFFAGASPFLPFLSPEDLTPDMAGIRPRLRENGFSDFVIERETADGISGLINLVGIDSPGLTSAPAIADHVAELLIS